MKYLKIKDLEIPIDIKSYKNSKSIMDFEFFVFIIFYKVQLLNQELLRY